jgi:predicted GTPase
MADVIVINKVDAARGEDVQRAHDAARRLNARAQILRAASPVVLDDPQAVRGRRVLVVDDGPTLTHGGMAYGAGYVAAVAAGAAEIVDPREAAAPAIRALLAQYPHIGRVLPAVGYDAAQRDALARSIAASRAEVVVSGTPFDLTELAVGKPVVRARYGFAEASEPGLGARIDAFLAERGLA